MERGVWGMFVLLGLFHFSTSLYRHKYYLINTPLPWLRAQTYCRQKYTDLATISESWEVTELSHVVVTGAQFVFTGLYKNWGWSWSDVANFKGGELVYSNWASAQPLSSTQDLCGTIGATGEWFVTNCGKALNFICYNGSVTDLSKRFFLGSGFMNWNDAQAYCRKYGTDLAKVQNQLENNKLQAKVNGQVWIGLTGLFWLWSDGSAPSFIPWKPQEPLLGGVLACGALNYGSLTFGMLDADCAVPQPFFCYNVPRTTDIVRLALTSEDPAVDMKDPAVIESILKEMENRLTLQGASVKLSWTKLPEIDKSTHMASN